MKNLRGWILILLVAVALQPMSGDRSTCPPSDVAARKLTAQQLSKRVVRRIAPTLPSGFGRINAEISVVVLVDEKGAVACVRGDEEAHPILRKHCEEAALEWKFKPLAAKGRPMLFTGPIVFHLKR